MFKYTITQSFLLLCSLIDRRGFLPLDEPIPAPSASEMELPPFVAKNDAHMVGWTSLWSLPGPDCPIVPVMLLGRPPPPHVCLLHSVCSPLHPPDFQLQSLKQSCEHAAFWIGVQCYEAAHFPLITITQEGNEEWLIRELNWHTMLSQMSIEEIINWHSAETSTEEVVDHCAARWNDTAVSFVL